MKRTNKKLVFVVIMIIVNSFLFTSVQARDMLIDPCEDIEVEYIYTGMTAEKAAEIIASWEQDSDNVTISPMGIWCLFGHDTQRGTITQIYHNISSSSPRCKEVRTDVEYCTRSSCDYVNIISEVTYGAYCH